jgi:trimeric autotransporter adhesin
MKPIILLLSFLCVSTISIAQSNLMVLKKSGKVVIGDTTQIGTPGNYSLYVQNGMLTERVKVSLKNTTEWSDGAFANTPTLEEVKNSIENQSHLMDMPSAEFLVKNGYELKEMDAKLLQQIEWLWQHVLRLSEENKKLQEALNKKE